MNHAKTLEELTIIIGNLSGDGKNVLIKMIYDEIGKCNSTKSMDLMRALFIKIKEFLTNNDLGRDNDATCREIRETMRRHEERWGDIEYFDTVTIDYGCNADRLLNIAVALHQIENDCTPAITIFVLSRLIEALQENGVAGNSEQDIKDLILYRVELAEPGIYCPLCYSDGS